MTCLLILSYHSITDLAKRGDPIPIGPYKGRLSCQLTPVTGIKPTVPFISD